MCPPQTAIGGYLSIFDLNVIFFVYGRRTLVTLTVNPLTSISSVSH